MTAVACAESAMRCLSGPAAWYYYLWFLRDTVGCLQTLSERHGSFVALERPIPSRRRRLNILAVGPEFNRSVLAGDSFRTVGLTRLRGSPDSSMRRLRTGLTRMNGEEHAFFRKLVVPPLLRERVELQHDRIVALVRRATDQWPVGQAVDIAQLLRTMVRTVAGAVLFGEDDSSEVLDVTRKVDQWLLSDGSPAVWFTPSLPGTARARMLRTIRQIEAQLSRWLERRRRLLEQPEDLTSVLLGARYENGEPVPDSVLVGQLFILLLGSHENVGNTLCWTLFLLSQHPAAMAELFDELHAELRGDPPSREQFDRLPALDAVVSESMRLLPSVPFLARVATRDTELGGTEVPEGSRVLLSPYLTHRLPELYPEPERFIPQRWRTLRRSGYEYMPFGAGPRRCIGSAFALRVIKIALALVLQRYRLTSVAGARVDRRTTFAMSPLRGLPMTIHAQDRRFEAVPVRGNIHEMVHLPQ